MSDPASLTPRIEALFAQRLHLVVPAVDTDLFESGSLDSLSFVELLLQLEHEYGVEIPLQDLELEHFRSIARIAEFIAQRLPQANVPPPARTVARAADG